MRAGFLKRKTMEESKAKQEQTRENSQDQEQTREEFLAILEEHGLSEEEYGLACQDYFDGMKSAMHQ